MGLPTGFNHLRMIGICGAGIDFIEFTNTYGYLWIPVLMYNYDCIIMTVSSLIRKNFSSKLNQEKHHDGCLNTHYNEHILK